MVAANNAVSVALLTNATVILDFGSQQMAATVLVRAYNVTVLSIVTNLCA